MASWIWVNIGSSSGLLPNGITWTNVDLSSVGSIDIHMRAILQEKPKPSVNKINLNIVYLKVIWNLGGANELMRLTFSHFPYPPSQENAFPNVTNSRCRQ